MNRIQLLDREFELSIPETEVLSAIDRLAAEVTRDLKDKRPLFLCVLNGSFMFASDLMKRLTFECEISFVKMASYSGMGTTGRIKQLIGLNENIEGRTVVLMEDIVDTGSTITNIIEQVKLLKPKEVKIATMLYKPDACLSEVHLDYVGMEIPNDFIVGYGLDYDGFGRNLRHIYTVVD